MRVQVVVEILVGTEPADGAWGKIRSRQWIVGEGEAPNEHAVKQIVAEVLGDREHVVVVKSTPCDAPDGGLAQPIVHWLGRQFLPEDERPVAARDPRDVAIDELKRSQRNTDRKLDSVNESLGAISKQLAALVEVTPREPNRNVTTPPRAGRLVPREMSDPYVADREIHYPDLPAASADKLEAAEQAEYPLVQSRPVRQDAGDPIGRPTREPQPMRTPEMAPRGGKGELALLGPSPRSEILMVDPGGSVDEDGNPKIVNARLPRVGDTLRNGNLRRDD